MSDLLKCDPRAYWCMKEIINRGELEGFDGAVAAVKSLTGKDMSHSRVVLEVCLPPSPIYPDGYGYLAIPPKITGGE